MKTPVVITAVWLRRIGDRAEVLVELANGGWYLAIDENAFANYSHIAEGNGAHGWLPDPLGAPPSEER